MKIRTSEWSAVLPCPCACTECPPASCQTTWGRSGGLVAICRDRGCSAACGCSCSCSLLLLWTYHCYCCCCCHCCCWQCCPLLLQRCSPLQDELTALQNMTSAAQLIRAGRLRATVQRESPAASPQQILHPPAAQQQGCSQRAKSLRAQQQETRALRALSWLPLVPSHFGHGVTVTENFCCLSSSTWPLVPQGSPPRGVQPG